jgi:hypothetical protein
MWLSHDYKKNHNMQYALIQRKQTELPAELNLAGLQYSVV